MDDNQPLCFRYTQTPGLVSVVMPTRNGRRFLAESFAGLASQTYQGWELIVVEDGSQDGAEELVRQFAAEHPQRRIVYRRNAESCGAAYSRNVAFLESKGEYIAFLDCDDRWLPTHLAACVGAIKESGDDLAYSSVVMFADDDNRILGVWGPTREEVTYFPQSLLSRSFVTPSATVVRRSVVGRIGAWDSQYRCCEDADFMLRAAAAGVRFRYVGGVHCLYRKMHDGATTQKLAETIEECAGIAKRHIGMPGTDVKQGKLSVAATLALAAKLHSDKKNTSDPSIKPRRAAPLYYAAWRLRPRRWQNLMMAAVSALRHGVGPVRQPLVRPSLPPEEVSVAAERRSADRMAA